MRRPAPNGSSLLRRRRMRRERSVRWSEVAGIGAVGAGTAFLITGGLLSLAARIMARIPLVPQGGLRSRPNAVVRAAHTDRLHLDVTEETDRGGYLALRQAGGAARVRLGPVTGRPTAGTVSRPVLGIDGEEPSRVGGATVHGYYWSHDPESAFGFPTEHVEVDSPVGYMPAWLVRPEEGSMQTDTWAILIHGHGATREETLRALPLLRELGLTSLVISYRNDAGAPASADRMYHLGAAEWEDADAALAFARARGARRIVILGWSMGGGIALRTAVNSAHAQSIAGIVLISPAVDWSEILQHHATAMKAPAPLRRMALWMMTSPIGARLVRLHEPLALHEMRADHYARHLRHPVLITHGTDDATVPIDGSVGLAALRPDLIELETFTGASHTREWNLDPARWERLVIRHLVRVLDLPCEPDTIPVPVRDPAAQSRSGARR